MEALDYQSGIIDTPKPSAIIWSAVGVLLAILLGVLVWQITAIIQLFRHSAFADAIGSAFWISLVIVLAAVGVLVLELYSIWLQSRRASEAVGTLFAAPAFIVLPPILEAFAKLVHIPGISPSSADWKTVGILFAVGAVCGFIGYAHFVWYSHLRRAPQVVKVESVKAIAVPVAVVDTPPPPMPAS